MPLFEQALKDYLKTLDLKDSDNVEPKWYTGFMPDDGASVPDFAAAVIPEAGGEPTHVIGEFPVVTIRVRHPKAREANLFIRKVYNALQEFSSTDLAGSGIGLARIRATQGPVQIGRDDDGKQGRWIVQQTFGAIVPTTF